MEILIIENRMKYTFLDIAIFAYRAKLASPI